MYEIILKSNYKKINKIYNTYLKNIFSKLNINFKSVELPIKKKKINVLKSPHVNKKAWDQFEIKTYKSFYRLNTNLNIGILKKIIRNKPPILKIKIRISNKGKIV